LEARPPVPRHRPSPPPLPPPLSRLGNPASSGARTTSVRPSHSSTSVHRSASPSTPKQTSPRAEVHSPSTPKQKSPRAEVPVSLGHAVKTPQPPSQRPASCPPRSKMRDRPCAPSAPATKRPSRVGTSPRAVQMQAALARAHQRRSAKESQTQHSGSKQPEGDSKHEQVRASRDHSADPVARKPCSSNPRHHASTSEACETANLGGKQDRGSLAWAYRSVRNRRDPHCHIHHDYFQPDEKL
jgi:hypothetical protein